MAKFSSSVFVLESLDGRGKDLAYKTIEEAVGDNDKRVTVAEYTLKRVVEVRRTVEVLAEIGVGGAQQGGDDGANAG